jgi:MYXO-CTERM domain-containing protein
MQVGLAMAGLLVAAPLRAAPINEDFESYTAGQTLASQTDFYTSDASATVVADDSDLVNATKVLEQGEGTTTSADLNWSGRIQFSLDLKLPDTGSKNIYLWQNGTDRPLWFQIIDSTNEVRFRGGDKSHSLGNYTAGQWYRLTGIIDLDPNDGSKSRVEEVDFYTLKAGGMIDQLIKQVTDTDGYGAPTQVDFVEISGSGRFDNLRVTQLPEPAALSLLGVAGLLLTRRRRK